MQQYHQPTVNFQALAFVPHIRALEDALISRLHNPQGAYEGLGTNYLKETTSSVAKETSGKFVVLHLQFDKDMAAHSAYDFGKKKLKN